MSNFSSQIASGLVGVLGSLVGLVFSGFTILLFAFSLSKEVPRVPTAIGARRKPSGQQVFVHVWDIAIAKTGGFVVSRLLLALLATIFAGAFLFTIGVSYWLPIALWVLIFIIVYQQAENYFFSPKISSRTMDIHPALAFGSVLVGAAVLGPIGALIAIPVAAGVLAVLETYWQRQDLVAQLAEERTRLNQSRAATEASVA